MCFAGTKRTHGMRSIELRVCRFRIGRFVRRKVTLDLPLRESRRFVAPNRAGHCALKFCPELHLLFEPHIPFQDSMTGRKDVLA